MRVVKLSILFTVVMLVLSIGLNLVREDYRSCKASAVDNAFVWTPWDGCFVELKPNRWARLEDFDYRKHLFH